MRYNIGLIALCILVLTIFLKSYILSSNMSLDSLYTQGFNRQDESKQDINPNQYTEEIGVISTQKSDYATVQNLEKSTVSTMPHPRPEPKKIEVTASTINKINSGTKYKSISRLYSKEKLKKALAKASKETITILLWKKSHFREDMQIDPNKCGSCVLTYNETKITEEATKALLFVYPKAKIRRLPHYRRPDQFYVWTTHESARYLRTVRNKTFLDTDDQFNLTMTYREDADIYFPWATKASTLQYINSQGSGDQAKDISNLMAKKKRSSLWVVSNCDATIGAMQRKAISDDLIKAGLNIDRRGGCFPQNEHFPDDESAQNRLIESYKFYMAFENNQHCSEYITEKFWMKALSRGVVPVVWGTDKSDYLKVAPPDSFIHVNDYDTLQDLVDYLNYLDKNDTAYREYFEWRLADEESIQGHGRVTGFCQLCRVLHGINVDNVFSPSYQHTKEDIPLFGYPKTPRVVPSIREWFYGKENRTCLLEY